MPTYGKVAWAVRLLHLRAAADCGRLPLLSARLTQAIRRLRAAGTGGIDVANGPRRHHRSGGRRADFDRIVHEPGSVHRQRRSGGGIFPGARTARLLAGHQRRRAGGALLLCVSLFRCSRLRQVERRLSPQVILALGAAALLAAAPASQSIPQQSGALAAWEKMQKLRTTVSVMHITAHPDDEHGGVLAKLSRGDGARVTLLTLNRGESGDNAIGPQLFDALGLIRTEELLVSNRYYGVDQQYFTTVVDYGFSKLLEEALGKWGRETVLRDVVRIVRMERPTIILSRFQGTNRDGHGNHQAAGLMAQEAFNAAGDPSRYPEQIREGLRPWSPAKVYIGGVRADED